ncbi:VOC family protein [Rhodococcus erythropolis]
MAVTAEFTAVVIGHVDEVAAERLGATRVGTVQQDPVGTFQVLLDPEGNEWCVVRNIGR